MGFFKRNYDKPGPGVSKDEPQKNAFLRFWEIYFRKFFSLSKVNMLFAIPTIICLVLITFVQSILPNGPFSFLTNYLLVLIFPFLGGPTYVCRNYAREEHAFIFSDFVDAVKANWKQFLGNGFISVTLYTLLYIAINYYQSQLSNSWFFYIPFALCVILAILAIFAEFYIPVMIVTFNLKLRQIYKNAFIFAIMGLWRNILILFIFGVVWFISEFISYWIVIHLLVSAIVSFFFLFSFFGFLINFAVYPLIDQFMVQPAKNQNKPQIEKNESEEDNEPTFRDSLY